VLTIPHFNMPDFENCYLNNLNFRWRYDKIQLLEIKGGQVL